ncbi:limbic system-associated membrane protein-like [Actinia tenebrosa]|uniref:Limbic system-associated membrane protein-like n=1 Tax=Actinia tenebrosa TaxID=6105 RepID=A0A6P8HM81_ACTTE|nr:limbic system-associated membrane protein-like [Actinia tenebrosa]
MPLGNIMSEGEGKATLRINNITAHQSGGYECRASNNPNEEPVTMETVTVVLFKPQIDIDKFTRTTGSLIGKNISLHCIATGQPLPRITWYGPREGQIVSAIDYKTKKSVLTFVTKGSNDYGQYRCQAENEVGEDEHFINVTQLSKEVFIYKYLLVMV